MDPTVQFWDELALELLANDPEAQAAVGQTMTKLQGIAARVWGNAPNTMSGAGLIYSAGKFFISGVATTIVPLTQKAGAVIGADPPPALPGS